MSGEPKMPVPGMEQTLVVEKEGDEFEVLTSLAEIIQSKKENREVSVHEVLKKFEEKGLIPARAKEEITRRLNRKQELGANDAIIKDTAKDYTLDAITLYRDNVFEISNYNFFKAELFRFIDENLTGQDIESIEDLDKTAMIFFDIDGLKAVNDNAMDAHASGDLYLSKIVEVFNGGRTTEWLRSIGVECSPARRSGDEFMCALKGNISFKIKDDFYGIDGEEVKNESFGEYVMKKLQEDVRSLNVDEVQDFSDPHQMNKYKDAGLDVGEWPEDFRFKASMSGGVATLLDVLRIVKDKEFKADESYEELIVGIAGEMIKGADGIMMENKEVDKKTRRKSDNIHDRLIETVYRAGRSDEEQINELKTKNKALEEQNQKMREQMEKTKAALDTLIKMGVPDEVTDLLKEQIKQLESLLGE
ncbi:hypothetical protein ACFL08_02155 [Patescibacteria group bacterium]